jgi:tRNA threonylcarbamoyladenosine biosynthesis protein TsaB
LPTSLWNTALNILALDTSEDACSAALNLSGELLGRFELAPRRHTALILPMIDGLLTEAGLTPSQLDAIAFGRGPGSFTGVRIAAGVAQGIALGLDLPVLPISTLAGVALRCHLLSGSERILVALDARMGEMYCAAYAVQDGHQLELIGQEALLKPAELHLPEPHAHQCWFGAGSGWAAHPEILSAATGLEPHQWRGDLLCRAEEIARLAALDFAAGKAVAADEALPVYLRDKVIQG